MTIKNIGNSPLGMRRNRVFKTHGSPFLVELKAALGNLFGLFGNVRIFVTIRIAADDGNRKDWFLHHAPGKNSVCIAATAELGSTTRGL